MRLGKGKRLAHLGRATDEAAGDLLSGPEYAKRRRAELERIKGPTPAWAKAKHPKRVPFPLSLAWDGMMVFPMAGGRQR